MNSYQEPKYEIKDGKLCSRDSGPIPDDEPVFILRARDVYAAATIQAYAQKLPGGQHKNAVAIRAEQFQNWALSHNDRMHEPNTKIDGTWTSAGKPEMAPKTTKNPA